MSLILTPAAIASWAIASIATAGVVIRPFRVPEAVWAVAGAVLLVACGLLSLADAFAAIRKGTDVYLFLAGMMLTAELARQEGLFDWAAAIAVEHARGSPRRLFALVYAVGTVVTVLLSNDATAVVLTPAVYAATRAAGASPLPYLYVCAFIANAASFVLPISNPANLVVFGARMPYLGAWLAQFGLASVLAVVATFVALFLAQRRALAREIIAATVARPHLGRGGRLTAGGIVLIAVALLVASALDVPLGIPTFGCGVVTTAAVLILNRQSPAPIIAGVAWSVLPLVAGLFVLVETLAATGVTAALTVLLRDALAQAGDTAVLATGVVVAVICNLMNNLPAGLIAGSVAAAPGMPATVIGAMLIGVDVGPNLSVTGSLATILWLIALRREGVVVTARQFLLLGLIVMPPALILSIGAMLLSP